MDVTHAAIVAVMRNNPDNGQLEVLAMWSEQLVASKRRPEGHRMLKLPGGDQDYYGEYPSYIAEREVEEETYLIYLPSKGKEVWKEKLPKHIRHGFLVDIKDCTGELRTEPINDGHKERLEKPEWVPAATIVDMICKGHKAFCRHVCKMHNVVTGPAR